MPDVNMVEFSRPGPDADVNGFDEKGLSYSGVAHNRYYGVVKFDDLLTCRKCSVEKAKSEFYSFDSGRVRQPCKPCLRAERRTRYRNSDEPDKVWARNLARYGLTPADYDRMLTEQDSVCATCRRPQSTRNKRLAVDHDHVTGRVRQLLCDACNVTIGFIEKHQVPLDALVAYLARHRSAATAPYRPSEVRDA